MEKNSLVIMPKEKKIFNANNKPCDMLIGPCSCGAWHTKKN